ncbi:MAG: Type secretion system pilin [Candidatus Parcubacteria bacterium]|jgi:hypothetical protein
MNMKRLLISFVIVLTLVFSSFALPVFAVTGNPNGNATPVNPGPPATSDPGSSEINFKIDNPVSGFDDIPSLIVSLLEIVMLVVAPVIAVMIIYTGFLFVTARGNETQMETARKTLLYVVIGAAIILGAEIIAKAISGTVTSLM